MKEEIVRETGGEKKGNDGLGSNIYLKKKFELLFLCVL